MEDKQQPNRWTEEEIKDIIKSMPRTTRIKMTAAMNVEKNNPDMTREEIMANVERHNEKMRNLNK